MAGDARDDGGTTGRKFAGDVLGRAVFQILSALKGLILLPLIAREYGVTGYGIWSQISITAALLGPLASLRLNEAVVRYLSGIDPGPRRGRVFFSCAIVTWALSAVILLAGGLGVRGLSVGMFGDPNLGRYVLLLLGVLVSSVSFSLTMAYYRAISRITTNTVLSTIEMFATLAALIVVTGLLHGALEHALLVMIAIDLVLSVACLLDILRRDGGFGFSGSWVMKLLRYSLPLVPTAALYWVVDSSDRFVIVHFLGLDQAGVYSAAYRVTQIIKILVQPLSFVLLPAMASLWEQRRESEALGYLSKSLHAYILVAIPAVAGLTAIGSPLMVLLAGASEFEVSTSLVALLAVGELFAGIYQLWVYVLYVKERTPILIAFFAASAALNLVGNLLLVPRLGILGAAWATFLAYGLQTALVVFYARRLVAVPFPVSVTMRTCAAGALVYLSVAFLPGTGWTGIALRVAVGVGSYAVSILLLRLVRLRGLFRFVRHLQQ